MTKSLNLRRDERVNLHPRNARSSPASAPTGNSGHQGRQSNYVHKNWRKLNQPNVFTENPPTGPMPSTSSRSRSTKPRPDHKLSPLGYFLPIAATLLPQVCQNRPHTGPSMPLLQYPLPTYGDTDMQSIGSGRAADLLGLPQAAGNAARMLGGFRSIGR